jgi:hypothetical protein
VANSATAAAAVAAVFGAAAAEFAVGSAEEAAAAQVAAAQVAAGGELCSSRRAPDWKSELRTGWRPMSSSFESLNNVVVSANGGASPSI